jgi:broad specificity phosphatase PhoE
MKIPKSFYFVRHGQTEANANGLLCGDKWDLRLSALGRDQAEVAGRDLQPMASNIDWIASSPLLRATETAVAIAKIIDRPVQVIAQFSEWNLGDWEKQSLQAIAEKYWGSEDPPNGESRAAIKTRILDGLEKCFSTSSVLIVSHGGIWLNLRRLLKLPKLKMPNCAPHLIKNNGSDWIAEDLTCGQ